MRRYKIITRILLILPIINFAFALPVAAQETRQVSGDVAPDVAITMSAKRGEGTEKLWDMYFEKFPQSGSAQSESDHGPDEEMEKLWDMYFERLPGKPESSSAAPDHGSMDPPQMGTSEIQQQELSKSPSLDHYLVSPASDASLDHFLASPESDASADESLGSTDAERGSSPSAASGESSVNDEEFSEQGSQQAQVLASHFRGSGQSTMKSFLSKVASKLKFWRRISGPRPRLRH